MKKNIKDYLVISASLLDDVIIIGQVILILRIFHVKIPLPEAILLGLAFVALIFITYKFLAPAYRRRITTGAEGLIGRKGRVVEPLAPEGVVQIEDEYWKAKAVDGNVNAGETVEIVELDGLLLKVKTENRG
jgi:membrane-bound ClpP family serine protease